jgi:hypothetical protein
MATATAPRDGSGGVAPLAQWLVPALFDWLRAKGCRGIVGLGDDFDGDARPHWQDMPVAGWRVALGGAHGAGVLLAFDDAIALGADEVADVAALLHRVPALPLVPDPTNTVTVDHGEARRLVHDLRNGLNTLLINGSLLARAATDDSALQRSAKFVENAGAACADHLNRLSELLAKPQGRA